MNDQTPRHLDYQSRRPAFKPRVVSVVAVVTSAMFVLAAAYALRFGVTGPHAVVVHRRFVPWVLAGIVSSALLIVARTTGARGPGTRGPFIAAILLAFLGVSIGALAVYRAATAVDPHVRMRCASNLRMLGQALLIYGNDHKGAYPELLETLLNDPDLYHDVTGFFCPEAPNQNWTYPPTTQQTLTMLANPQSSYVYLGARLSAASPEPAVLIYEPLSNHGDFAHVLFGDGHVERVSPRQLQRLIEELRSGHNPPRQWRE